MKQVISFEQALNTNVEPQQIIAKVEKIKKKISTPKGNEIDKDKSASDKLMYDANHKLNYYLKKSPQYNIIKKQIEFLRNELSVYEKNNNLDSIEKTKNMINELLLRSKDLSKIFKTGDSTKSTDINVINDKIKASKEIKDLYNLKKSLTKRIQNNSSRFLISKISQFRKTIALTIKMNTSEEDIFDFDEVVEDDFTEEIFHDENFKKLEQDYHDFCGKIAEIIGWDIQTIIDSPLNQIKLALDENLEDVEPLKDELGVINIKISNEKSKINGSTQITDLMFDIFDFKKEKDEVQSKEILAASNIKLVRVIAYSMCSKNGQLSKLDDAVSAGLMGLTIAINKWFDIQKLANSALNFKGFANMTITGMIKRELLELSASSSGRLSGSTLATNLTNNKKKTEDFVKYNPEFEDLDKDLVMELLSAHDDGIKISDKVKYESDIIAGGEEGDSADMYANAMANEEDYDLTESRVEYEKMLESIKELLNLFEHKEDKKTGLISITDKKVFDKYDKRLFLMFFGLTHKIEKTENLNTRNKKIKSLITGELVELETLPGEFTQDEMAEELVMMYAADGITKTLTQSAVVTRIEVMLNKLSNIIKNNPKLKAGFEYFYNYWAQNKKALSDLSNSREELGIKLDRDELRDIYSDDNQALNTQLIDGSKLSDAFYISDSNPLDDEIYDMFN